MQIDPKIQELERKVSILETQMLEHYHNGVIGRRINSNDVDGSLNGVSVGEVNSAGTSVLLPSGWTCSKMFTGMYNVVHNLDSTTYVAVVNPTDDAVSVRTVCIANSFDVIFKDDTGTAVDTGFVFILATAQ